MRPRRRCSIRQKRPEERHAAVDRFLAEVQVLARLSHPVIPKIFDSFHEKNSFYFVMEYIEGMDLDSYLKSNGAPGLDSTTVMEWAVQVLSALEYIHALSPPVIHRDIKPSNLLRRSKDGRILLIDFGIARATNPNEHHWIGSPGYAPPNTAGWRATRPSPICTPWRFPCTELLARPTTRVV